MTEPTEEELEQKLQDIKDSRAACRSKTTKLCNSLLRTLPSEEEEIVISEEVEKINNCMLYLDDLEKEYTAIVHALPNINYTKIDKESFESYLTKFELVKTMVQDRKKEIKTLGTLPAQTVNQTGQMQYFTIDQVNAMIKNAQGAKAPEISLPKFNNSKEGITFKYFLKELETYFATKPHFTDADKFRVLREQLSGMAQEMVNKLPFDDCSYANTVAMLQRAFENTVLEKHKLIKKLIELKYNKSMLYYADLVSLKAGFTDHEIDIDDILQFFAWRELPSFLRTTLANITSKAHPSFKEIQDNIFEAQFRMDEFNELKKKPDKFKNKPTQKEKSVTNLAVNVQTKKDKQEKGSSAKGGETKTKSSNPAETKSKGKSTPKPKQHTCPLCREDNTESSHSLLKCLVYKDVEARKKRIKELSGCSLCAFANHESDQCKFNPVCKNCKGRHVLALCEKPISDSNSLNAGIAVLQAINDTPNLGRDFYLAFL